MAIRETTLPASSALNALRVRGDFLDCFFGSHGPTQVSTMEAAHIAMSQMPGWATTLMAARNAIVGPLGLKTGSSAPPAPPPAQTGVGDSIGIFKIISASDTEVVVGEDDRHLNFRASIFKDDAGFYLATWVKPHNLAGHAYLATIMVFHKLIVRDAVQRIVTSHPAS